MSTFKERLLRFIKERGISNAEFCRRIGVSTAYITSMRKGIDTEKMSVIVEEFPELNLAWLYSGRGGMLNPSNVLQPDKDVLYEKILVSDNSAALLNRLNRIYSRHEELLKEANELMAQLLNVNCELVRNLQGIDNSGSKMSEKSQ